MQLKKKVEVTASVATAKIAKPGARVASKKLTNRITLIRNRVYVYKKERFDIDKPRDIDDPVLAKEIDALRDIIGDGEGRKLKKRLFRVEFDVPPMPPSSEDDDAEEDDEEDDYEAPSVRAGLRARSARVRPRA